ncbi:MAG: DUF423 domain-containing protein [Cocleimonas sp.]|nr:DUF423 domain-containing protein [Cocleimonas sp.]
MNKFLLVGAVFSLFAVIIGAFGAHGLEQITSDEKMLARFNTGVDYQFFHAFSITVFALFLKQETARLLTRAMLFFSLGIILFSGSLYSYALTGNKLFGMITPLGGLAFIIGWVLVILYAYKGHTTS